MPRARSIALFAAASVAAGALFGACGTPSSGEDSSPVDAGADTGVVSVEGGTDADATPPLELPGCIEGKAVSAYPTEAKQIAVDGILPDLTLTGVESDGVTPKSYSLHDYYDPCASPARLLVFRVSAGWCGTCRWSVAHTTRIKDIDVGKRLELIDLLVSNDDNDGIQLADLATWRARMDRTEGLAIDPTFFLRNVSPLTPLLPLVVVVDVRTMKVRFVEQNPDPAYLEGRLRRTLQSLDGVAQDPFPKSILHDDLFSEDEWGLLSEIKVPGAPPSDPSNEVADSAAAAAFGKTLFSDKLLSPSGTVACSTCHDPLKQFSDGLQTSVAAQTGDRNAPQIALAAHSRWQFWDGRADSLWAQALGPFENEKEYASSRLYVAHQIVDRYSETYASIFAKYPLPDLSLLPAAGKPGDAAYDALTPTQRADVTRVYVNVGKSIAAFERTLRVQKNPIDDYIAGDMNALTNLQKHGLKTFARVGCLQCHYGPTLTDDAFHNVRFPTGRTDGMPDRGRIDGIPQLLAGEFLGTGVYSDSPTTARTFSGLVAGERSLGSFKTPSLRGIVGSAPFGHGGTVPTLAGVADHYRTAGLPPEDGRAVGEKEAWIGPFDTHARDQLVFVLDLFTGNVAP